MKNIIDFSKKKTERKNTGRFKVKIKTIESPSSLFVSYDISVQDFSGDDDYNSVLIAHYTGSEPLKKAKEMIKQIKNKKVTNVDVFYMD